MCKILMESYYNSLIDQYETKPDAYYENQRAEMLEFIPENTSSLLEIGCGSGSFGSLVKMSRPECNVWGIEPNHTAAEVAAEKLDKVICGSFNANVPELNGETFDCIVFNDVLEHLANPMNALIDCKPYLSRKGSLVASIPNILHFYQIAEILLQQDWKYQDGGILDNTHLRFFTKKSIV